MPFVFPSEKTVKSIARGWGKEGLKHRKEDYMKDSFSKFYKDHQRKNLRKLKINKIFNDNRQKV